MSSRARKIIEDALSLPTEERMLVVAELQDSLDSESSEEAIGAAWTEEIVRRAELIASGEAEYVDGEESARRIREKYGR